MQLSPMKHALKNLPQQVAGLRLSPWSSSAAKRLFDCVCVLLALPFLAPVMLVIAVMVRLTSRGPVLFSQERVGQHGRIFAIFKFRTMIHAADKAHHPITTSDNQLFTPVGPFLRRWKLDELPQVANVLLGHMSLVGPRPKLPEHVVVDLPCRPGITGMATNVFACEETVLARVPRDQLDAYYHSVVLPTKRQLDDEYMSRATVFSDLQLLVNALLRRWDTAALNRFVLAVVFEAEPAMSPFRAIDSLSPVAPRRWPSATSRPVAADRVLIS